MKIGILASGGLGLSTLKELERVVSISFLATDSKSDGIIDFAEQNNIPLFKGNPRGEKLTQFLGEEKYDLIFSINYLFLIEEDLLEKADFVINLHGSLLPRYRGRTPHVWAIINNEKQTGVTAHLIDKGCDTGDIVYQEVVEIDENDTGAGILAKYKEIYVQICKQIHQLVLNGQLTVTPQDHSKATYYGKRTPDDGHINWNWQKERIRNWVRAQAAPYPGAFSFLHGEKIVLDKVEYSSEGYHNDNDHNGKVIGFSQAGKPLVKTPNGVLELSVIRTTGTKFELNNILK